MRTQTEASRGVNLQAGTAGRQESQSGDGVPSRFYHNAAAHETVFVEDGRRRVAVGRYDARTREFRKTVKANQILHKPEGIALQVSALRLLKSRGCRKVIAWLPEQDRELSCPFEAFERFGVTFDRGYGAQVVLPMTRWIDAKTQALQRALW